MDLKKKLRVRHNAHHLPPGVKKLLQDPQALAAWTSPALGALATQLFQMSDCYSPSNSFAMQIPPAEVGEEFPVWSNPNIAEIARYLKNLPLPCCDKYLN